MTYKCSTCGQVAEVAGNCPTCNVPMIAVESEEVATEVKETPSETTEKTPEQSA